VPRNARGCGVFRVGERCELVILDSAGHPQTAARASFAAQSCARDCLERFPNACPRSGAAIPSSRTRICFLLTRTVSVSPSATLTTRPVKSASAQRMANTGSLKARIEKLEAAAGSRSDGLVVLICTFTGGEIRGIRGAGTYWQRKASESEEALHQPKRFAGLLCS
jgi:hypothetical protein